MPSYTSPALLLGLHRGPCGAGKGQAPGRPRCSPAPASPEQGWSRPTARVLGGPRWPAVRLPPQVSALHVLACIIEENRRKLNRTNGENIYSPHFEMFFSQMHRWMSVWFSFFWLVALFSFPRDTEVLFSKTKRWCGHSRTTIPAVAVSVGLALGVVGGKEGLCPPP